MPARLEVSSRESGPPLRVGVSLEAQERARPEVLRLRPVEPEPRPLELGDRLRERRVGLGPQTRLYEDFCLAEEGDAVVLLGGLLVGPVHVGQSTRQVTKKTLGVTDIVFRERDVVVVSQFVCVRQRLDVVTESRLYVSQLDRG